MEVDLVEGLTHDDVGIGRAKDYALDPHRVIADVHDVLVEALPATSSMRHGLEAGRRTEPEALTRAVFRRTEETYLSTSINLATHALISGYQASRGRA